MKINSLKFNNSTIHKMYHGDELVNKIGDAFTYMEASGDTPTPPTPVPYNEQYLTIESTSNNNTIYWNASHSVLTKTVSASTDNGETWTKYRATTGNGTILATLNTGDKLLVKGKNNTYGVSGRYNHFTSTGQFEVKGNIMSLISGDSFVNAYTLTGTYTFAALFMDATGLTSAENLILPATTLTNYCYQQMFLGCTSLTTAPELPATTLAERCYYDMFRDCTTLTTVPELPATTLANSCYRSMFFGCTSLTTAPELPAETLANECYREMFQGCKSLTTAPELPALYLVNGCYFNLFRDCTRLNYIKAMFLTTPNSAYTNYWVYGVASRGTFVKNKIGSWLVGGYNGIPSGWSIVNE